MVYEYYPEVVNRSGKFNDTNNFVGYILPDGTIFKCEGHSVSNVSSVITLYLNVLDQNYSKKEELLSNIETNNKLAKVVINRLNKMSHDEIKALVSFINKNSLIASDLIVQFFECHEITRLRKKIYTTKLDYSCFYNYLLHDFEIFTVNKIVYDKEKKEFYYLEGKERNENLYDEINEIKRSANGEEISLFHKGR